MPLTDSQVLIIFLFIVGGYYVFWRIARKNVIPWHFKSYFLGGAKLGGDLTENNTVGITFAWSGGTWYFAWLAYQYGPWVLVSQVFWVFSIVALALVFPRVVANVKNKTIHGFLRHIYGGRTQRLAAVATTFGYFINAGFEVFWSSLLFSRCLGREELSLPVALVLAVFVATYCSIGGYKSNAMIDKAQNILGVAALAGLVVFTSQTLRIHGRFGIAVGLFLGGALLYITLSVFNRHNALERYRRLHDSVVVIFAVSSFLIVFALLRTTSEAGNGWHDLVTNSPVPLTVIISTVTFQVFFNVIDMQNWQAIAANGDAEPSSFPRLSWAMVRGALYLMWFPALGGILLGCSLRALHADVTDGNIFSYAFNLVLPNTNALFRGAILGFLFLGFISTSLSTVGDLLMSALQTISFDIVWPSKVETLIEDSGSTNESTRAHSDAEQRKLVLRARAFLIPLALAMVLGFFWMWKLYPGRVFYFQAVMYAMPLALLTPILVGLFAPSKAVKYSTGALWGLAASIVCVIVMFVVSALPNTPSARADWIVSFMPLAANAVSLFCFIAVPFLIATWNRFRRVNKQESTIRSN